MTRLLWISLTTALATLAIAAAKDVEGLRTWTSSGGKTLQAALVSVDKIDKAYVVTLKRKSGQTFDLPFEQLSDGWSLKGL